MNKNCVCYQIFWSIQASCSFEKLLQFLSWSPSRWYSQWSVFEKSIKRIPFMLISAVIFLLIYLWLGTKGKPDHLHSLRQTSPQSEQRILPYFQKYNHLGGMFYVHSTSSWLFSGRDGDGISSASSWLRDGYRERSSISKSFVLLGLNKKYVCFLLLAKKK